MKAIAAFFIVGGLVFATALRQSLTSSENTATSMIASPLALRRTPAVAPSAAFLPKVPITVNAISRATKEEQVAKLKANLDKSGLVVLTKNMGGLTVSETNAMRRKLDTANTTYQVIKNTLAQIAIKGTEYEAFNDMLEGPSAIIYADDPVQGAKAIKEVLEDLNGEKPKPEDMKLKYEAGMTSGQLLDEAGVEQLSKMPSIEEARTKLAVVLNQPATMLAQSVKAVPTQLARALQLAIDEGKIKE